MRKLLLPIAWLYGMVVSVIAWLYDKGVLKSVEAPLTTVCVGNITVGGTGKTPVVERLLRQGIEKGEVWALLSRGYRRKTKGLVIADADSTAADIGDEPMQIHTKFPKVPVVVCADRNEALRYIKKNMPDVKGVIMDDGMQHRSTKATKYIMVCDYARPVYADCFLPAGDLRAPFSDRLRADEVIINKCRGDISVSEREDIRRNMKLRADQKLTFACISYGAVSGCEIGDEDMVVAVAGIGRPEPFFEEVKRRYGAERVVCKSYADHHDFSEAEVRELDDLMAKGAKVLCTEKDFQRMPNKSRRVGYMPIVLSIIDE